MVAEPPRAPSSPTRRYGVAVVSSLLALWVTLLLTPFLGQSVFSLFFAAVMLSAWYGGLGPSLVAAGLSAAGSLFTLIATADLPALTADLLVRVGVFLATAVLISGLSEARRRSEAAAHAERERYAVTLKSIGDGVIVTDGAGAIAMMNPVAEELTGWPIGEAQGRPIDEVFRIVSEATRRPVESPVTRTLREGRIVGLANHTVLLPRGGGERPIDDSGAPVRGADGAIIGSVLVFRDITERRAAEQASEAALRGEQAARDAAEAAERRAAFLAQASALLASSLVAADTLQAIARLAASTIAELCVVFIRTPDGGIRRAAAAHADPEQEAALRALLGAPVDPEGAHPAAQVIRSGAPLLDPEVDQGVFAALTSDPGRQRALRALTPRSHLVVPLVARGTIIGALSLGRTQAGRSYGPDDVTLAEELAQRAALAVENARLYEEARAAIKVRDRFLSLAAHELRTPLTSALGNIQILRRRLAGSTALDERAQRSLRVADEQLARLNELISTLLDVSRLEGGQLSITRSAVDVCALARRVTEHAEGSLAGHTMSCEAPDAPIMVSGDAVRLEQALANLIQNAAKYSPEGGPITVRVSAEQGAVALAVIDRGVGMAPEVIPHLFERFYRAPDVEERGISGVGIGLYVVREIVRLHGGTVRVSSAQGEGSTFTLVLPGVGAQGGAGEAG